MKIKLLIPITILLAASFAAARPVPLPERSEFTSDARPAPSATQAADDRLDNSAPSTEQIEAARNRLRSGRGPTPMAARSEPRNRERLARQANRAIAMQNGFGNSERAAPRTNRAERMNRERPATSRSELRNGEAPRPAARGKSRGRGRPTPVAVRAELDRPTLPACRSSRAVIKISLMPEKTESEAKARPPVNLAIALDRSGSMSGEKLHHAKEAAIEALRMLGEEDRIALVTYASDAQTLFGSQPPHRRGEMEQQIRSIRANGTTALYAGVCQAAAEVRRHARKGAVNRIILLSDGQANVGPATTQDLRLLGASLGAEDISVSSIGLGSSFNEDLMTGIAETSEGNSHFAENATDLSRIFETELTEALNVAATEVTIVVEFEPGVRPVGIIGRDGKIANGKAYFEIRELHSGREKFALIEVDVPEGRHGQRHKLANVRVNYKHTPSGQRLEGQTVAEVSFSENEDEIRKASNPRVARAVVDNRIAMARREAIRMSDAGEHRRAAAMMRDLNTDVRAMNRIYEDAAIEKQAAALASEAEQLDRSRLGNMQRKSFLNSSYQIMRQQSTAD